MSWHTALSPQAARAQRDAAGRRALRQMRLAPRLSRTTGQAVAEKPEYWQGRRWSDWMRQHYPAWHYNPARRLWFGPLADLVSLAAKFPAAHLSNGVVQFLEEQNQ